MLATIRTAPLAGKLKYPACFAGRRVGIILSGGNVDLDQLPFHTGVQVS